MSDDEDDGRRWLAAPVRWKISGEHVPLGRFIGHDGEHIDDLGLCSHCDGRRPHDERRRQLSARRQRDEPEPEP